MNRFLSIYLCALIALLSCSQHNPTVPVAEDSGSAQVTVKLGKVGSLAKRTDIDLDTLFVTLSAEGETTIEDAIPISGYGQQTVTKTYSDLASLLKEWTLTAVAKDVNETVIHSGSITFIVPARDIIDVTLDLAAQYSMLKANYYPIRDSVTRCELLVEGIMVEDSSFAKQTKVGETVMLSYDYLSASPSGIQHTVKLDVYGDMWGFDTLLYSGDTTITVVSGEDKSYDVLLQWVGPAAPPPGDATMTVTLGAVGTVTINGETEELLNKGLVAYYPFNGNADDMSGNSYHGTVYNATLGADRFSIPDKAYGFDGTDNRISLPYYFNDIGTDGAVSVWIKLHNDFSAGCLDPSHGWGLEILFSAKEGWSHNIRLGLENETGKLVFMRAYDPYNAYSLSSDKNTWNADTWYHIFASFNGHNAEIYIDAILQSYSITQTGSGCSSIHSQATSCYIGSAGTSSTANYFDGSIDDIRIYNRTLSQFEIQLLFGESSTP